MTTAVAAPVEDFRPPKKEVEVLKVLAEKVKGHVKWYSVSRSYGFISRSDDGGDLFVHRSVISSCARRFPSLRNGEEVEFSVVETSQGIEATCVTGPGGQPVKGSWPAYRRPRATSDPNDKNGEQNNGTAQADRGTRPQRRRGNRRRSAGTKEATSDDNCNEGVPKEGQDTSGGDLGDAAVPAVPRQRRRPQRMNMRNRSAPTQGEQYENGDQPEPAMRNRRGTGRPFRRPFQSRGGMRYTNNRWNGQQTWGPYRGSRYNSAGDRNGYEQGPRPRRFRGSYSRGPRTHPGEPSVEAATAPVGEAATTAVVEPPVEESYQLDDNTEVVNELDLLAEQVEEVQIDEVLEPFMDAVDVPAELNEQ